ncbi:hypothetical protein SCLCIDRAFT_28901 [Scleroderma citrinum Foug A]|uniref:Uncharacterized protein n=1 Tax=Scleroderma citrinum Foug A TaxID=1036808 RepID=A0A0C2ZXV3_9AGAM|nr:hypothetical protein SCLCIDRAFT_28901 [Scleroderma citrinum Foug A]
MAQLYKKLRAQDDNDNMAWLAQFSPEEKPNTLCIPVPILHLSSLSSAPPSTPSTGAPRWTITATMLPPLTPATMSLAQTIVSSFVFSDNDVDLMELPFIPPVKYQVHQQPVIACAPGDCQPPGPSALANPPLLLPPYH